DRGVGAAEGLDVGAPAGPGSGDDVGLAVAVQVGGRDEDSAAKRRVVGVETPQGPGDLGRRGPVEDAHVGPAAGAGPCDDVRLPVAGDVAGGDMDSTAERGIVGVEAIERGAGLAVEDL